MSSYIISTSSSTYIVVGVYICIILIFCFPDVFVLSRACVGLAAISKVVVLYWERKGVSISAIPNVVMQKYHIIIIQKRFNYSMEIKCVPSINFPGVIQL